MIIEAHEAGRFTGPFDFHTRITAARWGIHAIQAGERCGKGDQGCVLLGDPGCVPVLKGTAGMGLHGLSDPS
ncbi:hypothetical protein ABZU94_32245 [Streptomyces mirabilis]